MLQQIQETLHRFYNINHTSFNSAVKDFKPIKSHTSEGLYSPYGNFDEMQDIYIMMYSLYLSVDGDLFRANYMDAYAHPKEIVDAIDKLKKYVEGNLEVLSSIKDRYTEEKFPIFHTHELYAKTFDTLNYVRNLPETISVMSLYLDDHHYKLKKELYINLDRISELREIKIDKFDLSKLIKICEELNSNWVNNNFFTVGLLLRTILNHIPPIFGNFDSFTQVIGQYGSASFKKNMKGLNESFRSIADNYAHQIIRSKEPLPNEQQVDYKSNLDVLLAEIIIVLNKK
jgi:hypothetical protein